MAMPNPICIDVCDCDYDCDCSKCACPCCSFIDCPCCLRNCDCADNLECYCEPACDCDDCDDCDTSCASDCLDPENVEHENHEWGMGCTNAWDDDEIDQEGHNIRAGIWFNLWKTGGKTSPKEAKGPTSGSPAPTSSITNGLDLSEIFKEAL